MIVMEAKSVGTEGVRRLQERERVLAREIAERSTCTPSWQDDVIAQAGKVLQSMAATPVVTEADLVRGRLAQREQDVRLGRLVELIEGFGRDEFDNGTVVSFIKKWPCCPGEEVDEYTYAAVKANDLWYLTGRRESAMRWEDFLIFLVCEGEPTTEFAIMVTGTTWKSRTWGTVGLKTDTSDETPISA